MSTANNTPTTETVTTHVEPTGTPPRVTLPNGQEFDFSNFKWDGYSMIPELIDTFACMGLFPDFVCADGTLDWDFTNASFVGDSGTLTFNADMFRGYMLLQEAMEAMEAAEAASRPPRAPQRVPKKSLKKSKRSK